MRLMRENVFASADMLNGTVCFLWITKGYDLPYDFGKRFEGNRGNMGGSGSGRRWNSKETTSAYYQLDIRRWQREGLLEAFQSFLCLCWKVDVLPAPNCHAKPNRVFLSRLHGSGEKRSLWLEWTP